MIENFDSTFPSSTHRYCRFPRYSTCVDRNASSAVSAKPGAASTSWSQASASQLARMRLSRMLWPPIPPAPSAPSGNALQFFECRGVAAGDAPRVKIAGSVFCAFWIIAASVWFLNGDLGGSGIFSCDAYRLRRASTELIAASTASFDVYSWLDMASVVRGVVPPVPLCAKGL